jgi:3,4-dehydroadipyl-CoA semialdehyde dehydrogenase
MLAPMPTPTPTNETTVLRSYVAGRWVTGSGEAPLLNPATEEVLAHTSTQGIDFRAALVHARDVGGPALRALTFAERGEIVRGLSRLIHTHRDELIQLAIANGGNTRGDAKFDVDGASATLAAYAELGAQLGVSRLLLDGTAVPIGRSARYVGQHVLAPRRGVAVHINAFNFPAWGLAEKAAVALLAGMPVVSKPATATALVAARMTELFIESKLLPEGAFSFIAGSAGDLLEHLQGQDVLAFTGSSDTAATLRALRVVVHDSVRINVEADSLNSAVLGADVEPGSPTWDLFVADVVREMTQKTGQKCTAIRRIFVPEALAEAVLEVLRERLGAVRVGNPALEEVNMGPLSTASQLAEVRSGIAKLRGEAEVVLDEARAPVGVPAGKGFFQAPVLLKTSRPQAVSAMHQHEVFGPVATVGIYDGRAATAAELVARGGGSLVASCYADDRAFIEELVLGTAPYSGRLFLGSAKIAGQATPPGMVLPTLVHGGPGRAGGGEELGGPRGLSFYLQRTAVHGDKAILEGALKGALIDGTIKPA